jgi:prepilin-type processing-associated H-X9-DG protein
LAKAKARGQSVSCLNNVRQLQMGWLMYVHDNNDALPPNISRKSDSLNQTNATGAWVLGNAKLDTNAAPVEAGVMFPHVGSVRVYRCPADLSTVTGQPGLRRIRSYSIEAWLNCDSKSGTELDDLTTTHTPFNLRKYSRIVDPAPSRAWVFIDEHEMTIDDGIFAIANPWAFPQSSDPKVDGWYAFPADRHGSGANLSFADGHTEHRQWRYRRAIKSNGEGRTLLVNAADRADLESLREGIPHAP